MLYIRAYAGVDAKHARSRGGRFGEYSWEQGLRKLRLICAGKPI